MDVRGAAPVTGSVSGAHVSAARDTPVRTAPRAPAQSSAATTESTRREAAAATRAGRGQSAASDTTSARSRTATTTAPASPGSVSAPEDTPDSSVSLVSHTEQYYC